MKGAENKFAAIEDLSDEELAKLHDGCRARAEMTLDHINNRSEARHHKPRPPRNAPNRTAGLRARPQSPKALKTPA